MKIEHFVVGPVATNCYFVINDDNELIVVDPGDMGVRLADMAKSKGYVPVAILLTHGHFDHADGIEDFKESFPDTDIPVYAHMAEKRTLTDPEYNLSYSMGGFNSTYHADNFLKDDEKIEIAGFKIKVLHTPGHTPGGCCYYFIDDNILFSGDSLFAGSIGRTDFPGGNTSELIRKVKEKCFALPDDTEVYPGHEGYTTIGDEKKYNYFLQ